MAEWREELRLADDAVRLEYGWLLEAACLFPRLEGWSAPLALLHVAVVVSVGILSSSLLSVTVLMSLSDMAVLSETIHFLFLAVISLCILIVFNAERSIFVRGHALLAHFYRYEEADEEPPPERVAALREDVDRYKSLWLFFWPAYMSTCATFLVLLHAFSDSGTAEYSSVNTQLPFSYWTPWDSRVGRYYSLTLCLQTIHIYSCALALSSGLIVYISFSRNLCFQLGLLRLSISRLRQRAEWYYVKTTGHSPLTVAKLDPSTDETLRRCYQHCLKRNIEHHVRIYECFNIFSKFLGKLVLVAFIVSGIMIGAAGVFVISVEGKIGALVLSSMFCVAEIFNMFILCWYGEKMHQMSMAVRTELYFTNWYEHCTVMNELIITIQEITKKPLLFKAGGLVPANLATFTNIMNAAYSYFSLLYAFRK